MKIPDKQAVFGFRNAMLPFWTHVLWKRWVEGLKMAGKPGHAPYRVVYDKVVSRAGLHDYARRRGLDILDEVGTNTHLIGLGRLAPVGMFVQKALARISYGRLAGTHSNLIVVLRKL